MTGIILTFTPQEVSFYYNFFESTPILLQISDPLYFGFAILNWIAKANLIGGIYINQVATGYFTNFLIGGLALIKLVLRSTNYINYQLYFTTSILVFIRSI